MKIKVKPYNILLITAICFIIVSFLPVNQDSTIDIHLHDTYFVVAFLHIFWMLSFIAFIVWVLYLLLHRYMFSQVLTWIHVTVMILLLCLFASSLFFSDDILGSNASGIKPRSYADYSSSESFRALGASAKVTGIMAVILITGQFAFVINLILGIFRKR